MKIPRILRMLWTLKWIKRNMVMNNRLKITSIYIASIIITVIASDYIYGAIIQHSVPHKYSLVTFSSSTAFLVLIKLTVLLCMCTLLLVSAILFLKKINTLIKLALTLAPMLIGFAVALSIQSANFKIPIDFTSGNTITSISIETLPVISIPLSGLIAGLIGFASLIIWSRNKTNN